MTDPIYTAALAAAEEAKRQVEAIPYDSLQRTFALDSAARLCKDVAEIPEPVKNVQFYGAVADGKTINNAALARAVASGEVIFDKPGVYLLDGVNAPFDVNKAGCKLRVKCSGVILKIRQNNQSRSYVVRVTGADCDVDFADAQIIGDRDQHSWTYDPDGKWHEHGYGLWVSGARCVVYSSTGLPSDYATRGATARGCRISNCTGDGIGVAKGQGIVIYGFIADGNRRQGCSAFDCVDGDVHHNTFRATGPLPGVPDPLGLPGPFAGMDIEPDRGSVKGLRIHHNVFELNRGSGLTIWVRKAVLSSIEADIYENTFAGNTNNLWAKDEANRAHTITINLRNNISANAKNHDFRIDQGVIATIGTADKTKANVFDDINGDRVDRLRQGVVSPEIGRYLNAKVNADGWNEYI